MKIISKKLVVDILVEIKAIIIDRRWLIEIIIKIVSKNLVICVNSSRNSAKNGMVADKPTVVVVTVKVASSTAATVIVVKHSHKTRIATSASNN